MNVKSKLYCYVNLEPVFWDQILVSYRNIGDIESISKSIPLTKFEHYWAPHLSWVGLGKEVGKVSIIKTRYFNTN